MNKDKLIFISGFVFALAGFSIELSSNTTLINIVRLTFILLGISLIIISIKKSISSEYNTTIFLFGVYFLSFFCSGLINNFDLNSIVRELLLGTIILLVIMLLTNYKEYFLLKGIFWGSTLIIIYYFSHINVDLIFVPIYRLETALNPNGIGMIGVMYLFLTIYFLDKKEYNKFLLLTLILISLFVVLMTRSRSAILMMFIGIIYFLYLKKKIKILFYSFIFIFSLSIYKYELISNVLRIDTPKGYVGKKDISNLAGRTQMWDEAFKNIQNNTFFGVGPDNAVFIGDDNKEHSYHNALLQLFANYGIFAFLSIITMIIISIKNLFNRNFQIIYKIMFIAGLAGGMVESRLLNFGSPGNLLFLISLIYLSTLHKKEKNV